MDIQFWLPLAATLVIMGLIFFVVKDGSTARAEEIEDQPASAPSSAAQPASKGEGWRNLGGLAVALGGIGLAFSLFMKTSVSTSGLYGAASEVVNLDLQFQKGLAVGGSFFVIGTGVFCLAVGAILQAINQSFRPQ